MSCPAQANESGLDLADLPITPAQVAAVAGLVTSGILNDKLARQVFDGVLAGEGTPEEVVAARGLAVVSDDGALTAAVDEAIAAQPDVAQKIRDGKVAAVGALVGAVMKATRGQADAAPGPRAHPGTPHPAVTRVRRPGGPADRAGTSASRFRAGGSGRTSARTW